MNTIEINGYSFKYSDQGRGDPLVFVHGSASDYRTWSNQRDEFDKDFRTISYSRRYHWPNQEISNGADYSMDEHVRDLEVLLSSLTAEPASLVGHSYGAIVCLLLAIQSPELVRTLVLAEPPAITLFVSNTPKPSEILKLFIRKPRTAAAIVKIGAKGFAPAAQAAKRDDMEEALRLFGKASLGAETFNSLSKPRLQQARDNLIKAELLGSGFPPLDDSQIRRIQAPTLLASGQKSPPLYRHLLDRLQELLPDAERVEIPGASHIMHEDNPTAYNATLRAFLVSHTEKG